MDSSNKEKTDLVEKIRKRTWDDLEDLKATFLRLSKMSLEADDILWMIPDQDPMVSRFAYGLAKRFPIPGLVPGIVDRLKRLKASDRTPFIELLKDLNSPEQDEHIDRMLHSSNVQEQALGAQIVLSQPPQRVTAQLTYLLGHKEVRYRFRALQRVRQYLEVGMSPSQDLYNAIQKLLGDVDKKISVLAERAMTLSRQRGVAPVAKEVSKPPTQQRPKVKSRAIEDERPAQFSGRTDEGAGASARPVIVEQPVPVSSPLEEPQAPVASPPKRSSGNEEERPNIAATGTDQVVAQPKAVPDIAPSIDDSQGKVGEDHTLERTLRPVAAAPPTNDEPTSIKGIDEAYLELVRNLGHHSSTVRANTFEEASRSGAGTQMLAEILKVLFTQVDWLQHRVVQNLIEHDEDILTKVVDLLRHEEVELRKLATGFALHFSSYKLIIPCTENSADHDNIVRSLSLELLGRLENPDVIPDIIDSMKKPGHRSFGIRALRSLPSSESLQQFLGLLKDRNPGTRLMAVGSLRAYEEDRVSKYLDDLKDQDSSLQVRREAARIARLRVGDSDPDAPVDFTDTIGNQVVERTLDKLLQQVREAKNASLVIRPDSQPMLRRDGHMEALSRVSLSSADTKRMTQRILSEEEWAQLQEEDQIVIAYEVPGTGRYRGSIYAEEGGFGAVFDTVPNVLPSNLSLGLPEALVTAVDGNRGLILLSGGPHSGRTSTMNALIQHVNSTKARFVVTLEAPIEYSHVSNESFVCQRQVGRDCVSYEEGVEEAIQQGADVLAIGQIADGAVLEKAITAAENGALVVGIMNATSFEQAVERTLDFAEESGGRNCLQRLGRVLRVLQHQGLLKRADGAGKNAYHSLLVGNEAARVILEEKAVDLLPSLISLAGAQGMQSTENALLDLVKRGLVEPQVAMKHAPDKDSFEKSLNTLAEELG